MHALLLLCINQHTKFEVPSLTDFKDMIGAKIKNGSLDLDHTVLGIVCHPKSRT